MSRERAPALIEVYWRKKISQSYILCEKSDNHFCFYYSVIPINRQPVYKNLIHFSPDSGLMQAEYENCKRIHVVFRAAAPENFSQSM